MKRSILLVNPPDCSERKALPGRASFPFEHLGLGSMASVLRAEGHAVEIVDANLEALTLEETKRRIGRRRHDIVGFSATHGFIGATAALAEEMREEGFAGHLVLGGHLPTFRARELLEDFPAFDSVVRGEGELTLLELAESLSPVSDLEGIRGLTFRRGGEIVENPPRPLVEDLDSLPEPARDTLSVHLRYRNYASISSSRGCTGGCTFCSIHSFFRLSPGPRWRARSPERIVGEMEGLVRDAGVASFAFPDDNFLGPGEKGRRRAYAIGREILRRKLKVSYSILCRAPDVDEALLAFLKVTGLRTVFVGFESGIPRALETYGKGATVEENMRAASVIRKLRLKCYPGFIMFDPFMTLEEARENLQFVEFLEEEPQYIRVDDYFNSLHIFAGAPIEKTLRECGNLQLSQGRTLQYDVLPCYNIRDGRVEALRRAVKAAREKLEKIPWDTLSRGGAREDFTEGCDELSREISRWELALFRRCIEAAERGEPLDGAGDEEVERLNERIARFRCARE